MATNPSFTGFHPWLASTNDAIQSWRRRIASNPATGIFKGDCVKQTAAGVWGLATAAAGVGSVSQGASYFDATIGGRRENPYMPSGTTYTSTAFDDYGNTDQAFIYIVADPVNTRFQAQYSASVPALTDLTKNANFAAGSGGSTASGISSHVLDQTTLNTTAALDFHIIDIKHNVLNDPTQTALVKAIVQINVAKLPPFGDTGTTGV